MKRILFQSHMAEVKGGAELSLLAIIEEGLKRGYEVHVIVPGEGGFDRAAKALGAKTHTVRSYWWTKGRLSQSSPNIHRKAVGRTAQIITEVKPVLCVTNTIVVPWLAAAAARTGFPHAWVLREFGGEGEGLEFWRPYREIVSIVDQLSDHIFVNSEALKAHFRPLVKSNISVITPVVIKQEPETNKSPFADAVIKLVCVGTVREGKGQLDAVRAVKVLKDKGKEAQLLLVGSLPDNKYEKEIRKIIREHRLNVKLCGHRENPANYTAFADIALVCSKNEGFGRVTIEPLLLGVPVIGTNAGGTKAILGKFSKELLYEYGNAKQLAEKIESLVSGGNINKIAQALKAEVAKKYSPKTANVPLFTFINQIEKSKANRKKDEILITGLLNDQKNRRALQAAGAIKRAIYR